MEDKELRARLSRIEAHLGMEPYDDSMTAEKKEPAPVNIQTVKIDKIGELLVFIEEKRQETTEEAFLGYLKKMEDVLCREQVKIDDYAENLYRNYEIYKKRHEADAAVAPAAEPAEEIGTPTTVAEPFAETMTETATVPVEEPVTLEEPMTQEEPATLEEPVKAAPAAAPPQQYTYNKPAKKTDMEFGIGAVVLSIVGALFIIASLVIFGLNFMDNLQQGIFFYVLAGVVIAFSELVLRKHLERFAQAVTGIGVCVLYTATILNYLYLHTMNSVAALLATVAISVFALLLSRKRESASLRMIGILGCYVSLMPLDKFESQTEFIVPCVILLIVNTLYLLLPVGRNDRAVRNVHSMANAVASCYLVVTAWISELAAGWIFVFVAIMLLIHYVIYYKTEMNGSLKGFFITGQIVLHILLTFIVWDEKFYVLAAVALALIHAAAVWLYRETELNWVGVHCWAAFLALVGSSMTNGAFLVAISVIYVIYHVLPVFFKGGFSISNKLVAIVSAFIFLANMHSDSNMQYVLLAAIVISIFCASYDKVFHEILVMFVLWAFGLFGFEQMAIAVPLSMVFLLLCVALFTKVDVYRDDYTKYLVGFAWAFNGIGLFGNAFEMYDPSRISMTIILLAESALLMLLFSETAGTKKENVVTCRAHALSIFYTYMVFAFGIDMPIVVSILLMIIAIASVGAGFLLKVKSVRIYGLCMSLFVCGKLLLVDFADAQSADRVISFLVVGVIALAISYLYMRIERSLAEKENL
ncbi:MAG: DUF2339 domain-containing protein [Lachnospiraceae bacterium]|nr:DUF2339 domain-containing protein [Lachnospiraceae bacterium]